MLTSQNQMKPRLSVPLATVQHHALLHPTVRRLSKRFVRDGSQSVLSYRHCLLLSQVDTHTHTSSHRLAPFTQFSQTEQRNNRLHRAVRLAITNAEFATPNIAFVRGSHLETTGPSTRTHRRRFCSFSFARPFSVRAVPGCTPASRHCGLPRRTRRRRCHRGHRALPLKSSSRSAH